MAMQNDVKEELSHMDIRLTEMEEKIDAIDKKLNQVIEAILGNPLTKSGGFIKDIDILEEKIVILEKKLEKMEEFRKRISWTIGLIVGVAVLLQYLADIYSSLKQ
jgi:tetrahydromethanopterin S-methyltransferase subunit G